MNIEDAQKFAEQIGIQLFETSAKDNINVEEVRTKKAIGEMQGMERDRKRGGGGGGGGEKVRGRE